MCLLVFQVCANAFMASLAGTPLCNPGKTELFHFSPRFLNNPPIQQFSFSKTSIELADKLCDLGGFLCTVIWPAKSQTLTLCADTFPKRISNDSGFHAFITSRLDYCKSLWYGLPACDLDKLKCVQNTAARLVTGANPSDHTGSILYNIHWLPINERLNLSCYFLHIKLSVTSLQFTSPKFSNHVVHLGCYAPPS